MSTKKSPYNAMNNTQNSSFYTNVSNCIICLDEVRCRGKLSVCKHWFCYGCILEWSKNTNTCPVCKTRFRSISKVHLSPLKSPPTKVRVPDKDQRVWNDDDDAVAEELLYDILNEMREDMDDDYEPPTEWSTTGNLQYELDLDGYDLEDSFIDDSNLTQETQPSSHRPERFFLTQQLTEEEEYALVTRSSPYMLRRRSRRRGPGTRGSDVMADIYALNNIDEETVFEDISSDESCADSISTDSSLSEADEEEDESNKRKKSTRSSRNTRSQGPRRSTRSQTSRSSTQAPTRNTRSQAPTRNTRSQAPRRSTRSEARHQKEQTRNQRQREDELVAQNIQDTGSSGWLNTTRSANERAAATVRAIAQTTNHNSSSSQTWGGTAGPSHERVRNEYRLRNGDDDDDTDDDDIYDSDESGKSPKRTSTARATEDTRNCQKKLGFSRIRIPLSSESELSDTDVLISPTKPNVLQKSPRNQNRNSPVPRNMDNSLPSTSRIIEDDDTTSKQSEVKKWKRISNGKKGKGKENKPLSRSLFSQSPLVGSTDDPDFIQDLPDELPSKRRRLGLINNSNISERRESSSTSLRVTRAQVRRLDNSYHPLDMNVKGSASSSQSSSLTTEGVNHGYMLRKPSQGYQKNSDDDDWDDYDSDDAKYSGKRRRNGASVRMPRDYKDTTDEDDDEDEKKSRDKEKSRKTTVNRSHGDDVGKGKRKETTVSRLQKCRDDNEDDNDYQVSTGKNKTTSSVTWLKGKPTSTNDDDGDDSDDDENDDDDNDYIVDDEPPNIIIPTPQPDKKRSLFTKRQHKVICEQFDDQPNEQDLPRYGRYLATRSQLPKSSNKSKPGGHENENRGTKVMPCRGSGINLVKNKVCNDEDFTPETSVNYSTVTRTRRRIKVYDSDSD